MSWRFFGFIIAVFVCTEIDPLNAQQTNRDLLTVAELSDFQSTSLSAEVEGLIAKLDADADHITTFQYGTTVQNRPMTAAICSNPKFEFGKPDSRAIALVIGNIHSGECDGKEAILMLLREIALNPDHPWLKKMVVVFVPNYNADGNDKVSKDNRPGQIGPVNGMGVRETSENFDLNRDFMKLESREGRAMVGLINRLNPHMFIDCHTTNGSKHRYQLTYDVPHNPSSPAEIREMLRKKMMPEITERLSKQGLETFYYGNFDREFSSWTTYGFEPRYSTEYVGLRGRIAILSESYSYIGYKERVMASKAFVTECLDYLERNSDSIRALLDKVDKTFVTTAAQNPEQLKIVLNAELQPFAEPYLLKGYKESVPVDYTVKFFGSYSPTIERDVPAGYLFSSKLSVIADKLRSHGVVVEQFGENWHGPVVKATVKKIQRAPRAFQGHQMVSLKVEFVTEEMNFSKGDFLVRTAQPLGRLASYMLESETNDGLVTWNYLDDMLKEGEAYPIYRSNSPKDLPLPAEK